ncbi:MAG: right-handed parallel beta-helix repeat-containing protein [Thermoproteota archaeon]
MAKQSFDVACVLALMLSLSLGLLNRSGQEQPTCTVIVQPGQLIQKAIDRAQEGAVICVSADSFPYIENLTITKGLTLRGAGKDRTFLKGKEEGKPAINITGDKKIQVSIEDLTVASTPYSGLTIWGNARVTLRNIDARHNGDTLYGAGAGLLVSDSSQVDVYNSRFYDNLTYGLFVSGSALVTIKNSQFFKNATGISAQRQAHVNLINSQTFDNRSYGLSVGGSAMVEVQESHFLDNSKCGLGVWTEEAQVLGPPQEFQGNGADLCGFAPASLRKPLAPQTTKSQLAVPRDYANLQEAIDAVAPGGEITIASGTYEAGLTIWKPLTLRGATSEQTILKARLGKGLVVSITSQGQGVTLRSLTITGSNGEGLLNGGRGSLIDVRISGNGEDGLAIGDSAVMEVQSSIIIDNGTYQECDRTEYFCNGVSIAGQAQVSFIDSTIKGNADWGIGVTLKQCGYPRDAFTGSVIFEGTNIIEGNNYWGNQKGMGNPGNHPWNNPSVPDGQVCLP